MYVYNHLYNISACEFVRSHVMLIHISSSQPNGIFSTLDRVRYSFTFPP